MELLKSSKETKSNSKTQRGNVRNIVAPGSYIQATYSQVAKKKHIVGLALIDSYANINIIDIYNSQPTNLDCVFCCIDRYVCVYVCARARERYGCDDSFTRLIK